MSADNPADEHDKQICAAALIHLEGTHGGLEVSEVWFPDHQEREDQAVDLSARCSNGQVYVLEHTLIQTYPQQKSDSEHFIELFGPLEKELSGSLPSGDYTLSAGILAVCGATDTERIRACLKKWVLENAPGLDDWPPGNRIVGTPDGVPFEVVLTKHKGETCRLRVIRSVDLKQLEEPLRQCLETACEKKLPKLLDAADEMDARSIFVLESEDHLKDGRFLKGVLEKILAAGFRLPTLACLVETHCIDPWFVSTVYIAEEELVAGQPGTVRRDEAESFLKNRTGY